MRKLARSVIAWLLGLIARLVIRKYKPRVVAITGSVGKTTTTQLTAAMLATRYKVGVAASGYNSEFGVPLTILGQPAGRSALQWAKVLWRGLSLLTGKRSYPEMLVLEMGADHPGDIRHLTSIAAPDASVVTNVRNVHLQFYGSLDEIAEEKSWVVRNLKPGGAAVLNADDNKTRVMRALAPKQTLFYGLTEDAHVWADHIKQSPSGLRATVHFRGSDEGEPDESWKLETPLAGRHQLYGVLAALSVALSFGVTGKQALAVAKDFNPPPGRGRVLAGKNGLTLIDDTYNASPEATVASLEMLKQFPGPHRAILGDMKELGSAREAGHGLVGKALADWLDELVVVGDDASIIANTARDSGMAESKIQFAPDALEAAKVLNADGKGGTVLIKASQSLYLERAVEALLKDPKDKALLHQRLQDPAHRRNLSGA